MNKKYIPLLILVAGAVILGLRTLQVYQPDLIFDDAFISFRYAENLAQGSGLVFNPGERVEGYTNFLWTAILAAVSWAGMDIVQTSVVLAALAAVACLAVIYLMAISLFKTRANSLLLIGFPILGFALMGSQARYILSGMETLLFTFLLALSVYLLIFTARPILAGMAFAACAMTRPEGVMYFIISLSFITIINIQSKSLKPAIQNQTSASGANHRPLQRWRPILSLLATFALVFGIYFFWRYSYYGDLLPNTFYAKAAGMSAERIERGWDYLVQIINWWSILPILLLSLLGLRSTRRNPAWFLFAILILATAVYFVLIGGDFIVWFGPRFFMPVLPFLLLLAAEGLANLETLHITGRSLALIQAVLVLLVLASVLWLSWPARNFGAKNFTTQMHGWAEVGRWLADHSAPDAVIATDAAGLIPFYSRRPAIDMFGLADRHIAHVDSPSSDIVAHEKTDPGYILARQPDCIVSTWLDRQGSAISAGLDTVKDEFNNSYVLVAVAKVRGGVPEDGHWILPTTLYSDALFNDGYQTGVFCLRQRPEIIHP